MKLGPLGPSQRVLGKSSSCWIRTATKSCNVTGWIWLDTGMIQNDTQEGLKTPFSPGYGRNTDPGLVCRCGSGHWWADLQWGAYGICKLSNRMDVAAITR